MQQILIVHGKNCLPSAYVLRYVWLRQLNLPLCGKVMFIHLSVILFMGGGRSLCPRGVSVQRESLSRGVSVPEGSLYK